MEPLSQLLPKTLRRLGLAEHADASVTVHRAQQWINAHLPALADAVSVQSVEGNTLLIGCSHPVAAQELRQVSGDLLAFLADQTSPKAPTEARITRL